MTTYQHTFVYQPAAAHDAQQHPRSFRHFSVAPLSGAMGAEIEGIDLRTASDEAIAEVEQALTDHLAIIIRDQQFEPAEQIAFARRLGRPFPWPFTKQMDGHPEISELLTEPSDRYNFGGTWHSDSCNFEQPPKFTMLYAVEIPPVGGDTSFSNQYLAWETLAPELRAQLETMKAVNSTELGYGTESTSEEVVSHSATKIVYPKEFFSEVLHPVARTHPVTGRKALYVNDSFTASFEGQSQDESLPLLRKLWAHSIIPEFTCRFRWKKGSLAIWDNRCCMHYAHNDYRGQRRLMRRIVVEGERPV